MMILEMSLQMVSLTTMTRREELLNLSGQIINGIMSSDSSFLSKLLDRSMHDSLAKVTVGLAKKILKEIDVEEYDV